ncbi:MAG: N-6 DNA methylase [Selenomonadaceae bacterium]|nr:N-6 DNA methylase [Selenomonadaceae bacterium]
MTAVAVHNNVAIGSVVVPDGKIYDYIDHSFRNDTPEEYVRQTIEKRLVNEHLYSPKQIRIEYAIKLGSRKPRVDIAVWEKNVAPTQENIKIIIECKRESVDAHSAKDGVEQLKSYMSACLNCEWGMWTNSKEKYVLRKCQDENGGHYFMEYNDIPAADGNLDDINKPQRNTLKNAADDNLLFTFRTCHNHIYANDGLQKQPAFFELLKIIFCKIEDERNIPHPLEFYTTSEERSNSDGQLTVKKRLNGIFARVKKHFKHIFEASDELKLSPRSLAYIVSELQGYSLLNTNIDIKGKAYEEIVGANLRGDRGEFFTPRNVMRMVVRMINPRQDEKVLDSSCGTGGFLVTAMTHVMENLEAEVAKQEGKSRPFWSRAVDRQFQEKVTELAGNNYFGFDINVDLVKATKMNMVMNNDGSGNILRLNSLLPPHQWTTEFRQALAEALNVNDEDFRSHNSLGYFDVIVTNPPFGSKIPIKGADILSQFELAHIWTQDRASGQWIMSERLAETRPPEILFVERCTQFLKPGGRLGIVLPDSILGSPGLGYIRQWLLRNHRLIASIDLHADTFQPRNGTQTSVLILQKKTQAEKDAEAATRVMGSYNIFMAMVEKIGHDKRGNPLFKRDDDGNEILVDKEVTTIVEQDGKLQAVTHTQKERVADDETLEIPTIFAQWKKQEGLAW